MERPAEKVIERASPKEAAHLYRDVGDSHSLWRARRLKGF